MSKIFIDSPPRGMAGPAYGASLVGLLLERHTDEAHHIVAAHLERYRRLALITGSLDRVIELLGGRDSNAIGCKDRVASRKSAFGGQARRIDAFHQKAFAVGMGYDGYADAGFGCLGLGLVHIARRRGSSNVLFFEAVEGHGDVQFLAIANDT